MVPAMAISAELKNRPCERLAGRDHLMSICFVNEQIKGKQCEDYSDSAGEVVSTYLLLLGGLVPASDSEAARNGGEAVEGVVRWGL